MKKMQKIVYVIFVLGGILSESLYAGGGKEDVMPQSFTAAYNNYADLRDRHAKAHLNDTQRIAEIEAALDNLIQIKEEKYFFYFVELYNFEKFEILNRTDEKAAYNLLKSMYQSLGDRISTFPYHDVYRLAGDICSRLITFEGSALKLSSEMKQYYERGLRLNKDNPLLLIGLGNYYLFAPAIGGGSDERDLSFYDEAIKKNVPYASYMGYIWKAFTYAKKGNQQMVIRELNNALKVFPEGPFALSLLTEAKEGKDIFKQYR